LDWLLPPGCPWRYLARRLPHLCGILGAGPSLESAPPNYGRSLICPRSLTTIFAAGWSSYRLTTPLTVTRCPFSRCGSRCPRLGVDFGHTTVLHSAVRHCGVLLMSVGPVPLLLRPPATGEAHLHVLPQ